MFLNNIALNKWIACVAKLTCTKWSVIYDLTDCVVAAESWTRILTLGLNASPISGTVGVDDALWSTPFVRVADVIGETLAGHSAIQFVAHCVRPTWRWYTRGGFLIRVFDC